MSLFILCTGLILLVIGVPVAVALVVAVAGGLLASGELPLSLVVQQMYSGADSFLLLAIPLFMAAGNIMNRGGLTRRIFKFASCLVGHFPGSLGHVNILASMIFAGMSGSAVADTAGLGPIEIQAMVEEGYDIEFSTGITVASSIIGPIIPPSIPMVVYGGLTQVSVAALFLGGLLPGVVMGLALATMVYFICVRRKYPVKKRPTWRELFRSAVEALPGSLTPAIILGGIMTGTFTPTEAAVIAVVYAILIGKFYYKELTFKDLKQILLNTCVDTAAIMLIVAAATPVAWIVAAENIPELLAGVILSVAKSPWVLLFIVNIFLLLVGCFMDATASLIIFTPILFPMIVSAGIDPVHFGVVMVLNLMIGLLTPPFGMVLFVAEKASKLPVYRVIRATAPFLIPLGVTLFLITYFPSLVTTIPRLLGY